MTDRWNWAREIWNRCFAGFAAAGYALERFDEPDEYWELHEAELRRHFPREVAFDLEGLRTAEQRRGQARIAETTGAVSLEDYAALRLDGRLAAMFCGHHATDETYRMYHSNVHPEFRRRGIYRRIIDCTLAYTGELGYDGVISEHALCNNPILIAKLEAGFRIHSFELAPGVGPTLRLMYFHNPAQLAAYEFHCGMATIDAHLLRHGRNAMPILVEQFRDADPGNSIE